VPEHKLIFLQKPQINLSCPSAGRMWLVTLCAFLCVLQSAIGDGGQSLVIAVVSFFTAALLELLLSSRGNNGLENIKNGSTAATAMVLCLLLPNQIHPVYAAFAAAFAITVVKYSFGGLGSNWLNPALGGWLFIRFSWPAAFEKALEGGASVTEMTATDASALDNSAALFLNDSIFSAFGVQLPSGYIDLLFSNSPDMIADRGLFALLAGTVVITALGINRGWVPAAFLLVYGFLIRFAGDSGGTLWNGDILYGLFSGGTIAAAFILAAEPASSAKLKPGILFAVVLSAVLSWFFRYRCLEYSGCFIALALVNCFTPLIRLAEEKLFFSRNGRGSFLEKLL